jgi:predicted TIM-barrel fold metal-dependent hydrolase
MSGVIDAHAHIMLQSFGSMKASRVESLIEHYVQCGVDQVWFSSADAFIQNQTELHRRCNDIMAALQEKHKPRIVGLATVNPRDGDQAARELERAIGQLGLRGLKLHGWLQPVSCVDPVLDPLFAVADRLRLVVLFHDGTPPYTSSLQVAWLAEKYPNCTMILGHGGLKDLSENAIQAVHRQPNVHLQTVAMTLRGMRRALEQVGPDRILFGTDGGFGDLKYIDYNILKLRTWKLSPAQEALVAYGNAKRLIGTA